MWTCIEQRSAQANSVYGRVERTVLFDEIYVDRSACLSRLPIATATMGLLKVVFWVYIFLQSKIF